MRTLRASEISAYLFCQRAWWFRRQGIEPENLAELEAGRVLHHRHHRSVLLAGCQRTLAVVLLLGAVLALTAYLTSQFL